jgi:hypothetical protein
MPLNKNRSNKNKSKKNKNTKKINRNRSILKKSMKGGGDFFISGKEPASFNNVPMHSFYTKNMYSAGTDVQHMQQSSRLMGGKRKNKNKSKKNKFFNKNKKGGGIISDLLTNGFSNNIQNSGSITGSPSAYNILAARGVPSYGAIPVNIGITNQSPLV